MPKGLDHAPVFDLGEIEACVNEALSIHAPTVIATIWDEISRLLLLRFIARSVESDHAAGTRLAKIRTQRRSKLQAAWEEKLKDRSI